MNGEVYTDYTAIGVRYENMLKNRNLWILMTGELIAGLGMWFGMIGNLEFMQHNIPSDFLKAAVMMVSPFIGLLLGPLSGRLVDRGDKKKIMLAAGLVRILGAALMFPALAYNSVWWMIGYIALIGGAAAFYFPALQSVIPLVVRQDELISANGMLMNIATFARVIGTAVAGVLLVYLSLFSLYLYTIIAYALLLCFTFSLQFEQPARPVHSDKKQNSGSFKDVFPVIKSTPPVLMALALTLAPTFFIGGFNLMVIEISEMQGDQAIKGLLYTTEGVSLIIGAFLAKRIAAGRNLITVLLISAFLVAVAHLSLYFADLKWMSLLSFGLFGVAAGGFFPQSSTLFQKMVPSEFHGRFFSFRGMLDRVLFQVIILCTGLFLDTIGFHAMVMTFGGISMLVVIYFGFRQRRTPVSFVDHNATTSH